MAKQSAATRRIVTWTIALVVVLAILGVIGKVTGVIGGKEEGVEVEVARAASRSITQVVTASGKIQPELEVKISPDVSGEIIELRVKEGDQVRQGDLLARIKPDFYTAQVEQAAAGVSQSQANAAQRKADVLKAESDFKRQQDLHTKGVISDADFQTYKTQLEVAKAGFDGAMFAVESAQARLREAREQLGKTNIYSPMTGTVSQLNVELGERVVGTSQMAGAEMMRVAKLDLMELEVDVNENDVVNISVGDTAAIEIDAYPERKFRGMVTEIANSARITGAGSQEQVTNFPVKVRILDAHNVDLGIAGTLSGGLKQPEVPVEIAGAAVLRPGMTGTVDVFTETVSGVIAIPIQAVTVRDFKKLNEKKDGKAERPREEEQEQPQEDQAGNNEKKAPKDEDLRKLVFLLVDGKAKVAEVETGISDDMHVQIKNGLKGGETVVVGPYRAISREIEPDAVLKVKDENPQKSGAKAVVASAQ